MVESEDVIIKNQNVCSIRRALLWRYADVEPAEQVGQLTCFLKSVGVDITYSNDQEKHLLNYIRVLRSKIPKGRKRKQFLDHFFPWAVQSASCIASLRKRIAEVEAQLAAVSDEKERILQKKHELDQSLQNVHLQNARLKAEKDSLKHRPKTYQTIRDVREKPYSKSHLNKLRKKAAAAASICGEPSTGTAKVTPSPARISALVDITNLSLRQYHHLTKVIPETPKLHRIKQERRRLVWKKILLYHLTPLCFAYFLFLTPHICFGWRSTTFIVWSMRVLFQKIIYQLRSVLATFKQTNCI